MYVVLGMELIKEACRCSSSSVNFTTTRSRYADIKAAKNSMETVLDCLSNNATAMYL